MRSLCLGDISYCREHFATQPTTADMRELVISWETNKLTKEQPKIKVTFICNLLLNKLCPINSFFPFEPERTTMIHFPKTLFLAGTVFVRADAMAKHQTSVSTPHATIVPLQDAFADASRMPLARSRWLRIFQSRAFPHDT
jgi:hypothetical protein